MEQFGSWSARATARQDFSPFKASDIAHIKAAAIEDYIEAGTRLLAAGDHVDRVMVIGSGEVELFAHTPGGRRVMAVVRKGGVIGDIPLFLELPMPYDAVVSRRALVCELDRKALLAFLASAPAASLRWMRSIALRLEEDRRRLLAVLTSDLTAQVARSSCSSTLNTAPAASRSSDSATRSSHSWWVRAVSRSAA